jgi:hypothetical protein
MESTSKPVQVSYQAVPVSMVTSKGYELDLTVCTVAEFTEVRPDGYHLIASCTQLDFTNDEVEVQKVVFSAVGLAECQDDGAYILTVSDRLFLEIASREFRAHSIEFQKKIDIRDTCFLRLVDNA